jgi:hypothetical protein
MDGPTDSPSIARFRRKSETKSKLKLGDPSCKGAQGTPEVSCVCEIGIAPPAGLEGRKVENVEDVEEVGSNFEVRRLTQMQKTRQPRLLYDTEIN